MLGLALLMGVGCSGPERPESLAEGLEVKQFDVRIGLSADDGMEGAAVLDGTGFKKLGPGSYVTLVEDSDAQGTLDDAENALATGVAQNSRELKAYVFAKTTAEGTASSAQAVQLTTTVLRSTVQSKDVRVEIDSVIEANLSGGAAVICEVEGEARLEGHSMTKIKTSYHLYPRDGKVESFNGPRDSGTTPLGVVGPNERFLAKDPSFYFELGPGVYELFFTMKLSAVCPAEQAGSAASVKASSKIGLR